MTDVAMLHQEHTFKRCTCVHQIQPVSKDASRVSESTFDTK
jgi:hypothetical protein